jgi:hypothetical protein
MGFPSPAVQFAHVELCTVAHSSLLRRASPSGPLLNNSTTCSFESSSHLGKNTPERKDYIMDKLVVPVEE